jgi:hypothetical protein
MPRRLGGVKELSLVVAIFTAPEVQSVPAKGIEGERPVVALEVVESGVLLGAKARHLGQLQDRQRVKRAQLGELLALLAAGSWVSDPDFHLAA